MFVRTLFLYIGQNTRDRVTMAEGVWGMAHCGMVVGLRRGKGKPPKCHSPQLKLLVNTREYVKDPMSMPNSPYMSWAPRNVLVPPRNEILAICRWKVQYN